VENEDPEALSSPPKWNAYAEEMRQVIGKQT
jgi:hypothetical protein